MSATDVVLDLQVAQAPSLFLRKGLDEQTVEAVSAAKGEPDWMRQFRRDSLRIFLSKPAPRWGADLSGLDYQAIHYFVRPSDLKSNVWNDVPAGIRNDYQRLGVPEAERSFCTGLQAQYDSEVVYGSLRSELARQGVVFTDTDTALREFPDLVSKYFGTVVPPTDNKFAALNCAVWSGGAFVYVPAGAVIEMPLHGYFHMNAKQIGQFEHTLIVLDEGARLHYVEACTAPVQFTESLHAGVVEIIVGRHARCRFTSIQNWAVHVDNLATKRALVHEGALMEWSGNIGARVTMSYPSSYLVEPGAHGEMLSVSFAGPGQHQDCGGKMIHAAPETTSQIKTDRFHNCSRREWRRICISQLLSQSERQFSLNIHIRSSILMTTQITLSQEHKTAQKDHVAWLKDCARWRSEHRQALAMLAKVEAAILEQEAALETHAGQIHSHETHLQTYRLADYQPGTPDYEELETQHAEFMQKHERAREAHERIGKHHLNIVAEIEKLLKICGAAM